MQDLIIRNVNLFDGSGAEPINGMDVAVKDGKITHVGRSLAFGPNWPVHFDRLLSVEDASRVDTGALLSEPKARTPQYRDHAWKNLNVLLVDERQIACIYGIVPATDAQGVQGGVLHAISLFDRGELPVPQYFEVHAFMQR